MGRLRTTPARGSDSHFLRMHARWTLPDTSVLVLDTHAAVPHGALHRQLRHGDGGRQGQRRRRRAHALHGRPRPLARLRRGTSLPERVVAGLLSRGGGVGASGLDAACGAGHGVDRLRLELGPAGVGPQRGRAAGTAGADGGGAGGRPRCVADVLPSGEAGQGRSGGSQLLQGGAGQLLAAGHTGGHLRRSHDNCHAPNRLCRVPPGCLRALLA
mmetsp:Transcript_3223/g.13227  ORF Transcript_3223/g.13227 Transcript_3223/m.13227 type:complete len:214 (+) Transcript_3223:472-1113(+)